MASSSKTTTQTHQTPESFESLARRNAAVEILRSYEKLAWWSTHRCESIAQTRLHFQNIVAGFTPEEEEALVDWKTDYSPHPPKGPEPRVGWSSRKTKERPSLEGRGGGGDGVAGPSGRPGGKYRDDSDLGAHLGGAARRKRKSGDGR